MGLFNTVLKSVAKKAAVAALLVVGKQVISKAIGTAIDKRKAEDAVVGEDVQATAQATPAISDTPVKAKPARKPRAKTQKSDTTEAGAPKKTAAKKNTARTASERQASTAKPRAVRKPKVAKPVASDGQEQAGDTAALE